MGAPDGDAVPADAPARGRRDPLDARARRGRGGRAQPWVVALVGPVGSIAAFLIALAVTPRPVRLLTALRRQTLDLADTALPDADARLRRGERLHLDRDIPTLHRPDPGPHDRTEGTRP